LGAHLLVPLPSWPADHEAVFETANVNVADGNGLASRPMEKLFLAILQAYIVWLRKPWLAILNNLENVGSRSRSLRHLPSRKRSRDPVPTVFSLFPRLCGRGSALAAAPKRAEMLSQGRFARGLMTAPSGAVSSCCNAVWASASVMSAVWARAAFHVPATISDWRNKVRI
jgi:hypothetical protein